MSLNLLYWARLFQHAGFIDNFHFIVYGIYKTLQLAIILWLFLLKFKAFSQESEIKAETKVSAF